MQGNILKARNLVQGALRASLFALAPCAVFAVALCASPLAAQEGAKPAVETQVLGDFTITLTLHPFLTPEDLSILRLVASDAQYLALFVPSGQGHAALAASPDEGFVKDGLPVSSAIALGGLASAEEAAQNATEACQKSAKSPAPCVVILAVSPK